MTEEYIERKAAKNEISFYYGRGAARTLDGVPSADVAPVVHGRWVDNESNGYKWGYHCSECGWLDGYPFNDRHKYCPNCGAKMDGGVDHETVNNERNDAK